MKNIDHRAERTGSIDIPSIETKPVKTSVDFLSPEPKLTKLSERKNMNKSMMELEDFFQHGSSSSLGKSTGGDMVLTMFDERRDKLTVSGAHEIPMNKKLFYEGNVLERVATDVLLVSTESEDRVVRVNSNSMFASSTSVEEDSPLFKRKSLVLEQMLLGGEAPIKSVIAPVRELEEHTLAQAELGYLLITNFRCIFVPDVSLKRGVTVTEDLLVHSLSRKVIQRETCFPLNFVEKVSCRIAPFTTSTTDDAIADESDDLGDLDFFDVKVYNTIMTVNLVDGRRLRFEIANTHLEKNAAIVRQVCTLFDRKQRLLKEKYFALDYEPEHPYSFDGWSVYNFFREMRRIFQPTAAILVLDEDSLQSIIGANCKTVRPSEWRVVDIAHLSSTYPKHVAIPRGVSDQQLTRIAHYRSRGRIPALCFLHPVTSAPLVRCSQPLSGITQARCEDDEFFFREMVRRNPSGELLVIYDARPFLNAAWNRGVKGGGSENPEHYRCEVKFLNIPNIHKVRVARDVMLNGLRSKKQDLKDVVTSDGGWLTIVGNVLEGAKKISLDLERGYCVVVHCTDGWDRTAQLVALACLMCDPYYRTFMGFQVLIESHFVEFGHKFSTRLGFADADDESPIFLQFLDCSWQLLMQNPSEFEFNETFLFTIAAEMYAGRFGTFMGNSARERSEKYQPKTYSLWSAINAGSAHQKFVNPNFDHVDHAAPIWAAKTETTKEEENKKKKQVANWITEPLKLQIATNLHLFSGCLFDI